MPIVLVTSRFAITGVVINGPISIQDNSSTQYTASVTQSNGLTRSVVATWSLASNLANAAVSASGLLTVPNITINTSLRLSVSYTESEKTYTSYIDIAVQNNSILSDLTLVGSDNIDATQATNSQYSTTASYGSETLQVTPTWSIVGTAYGCSINETGLLSVPQQSGIKIITVKASYAENAVTLERTKAVSIGVIPVAIAIDGSLIIPDNTSKQYTATVVYSDSTLEVISPVWTLSGDNSISINSSGLLTVPDLKTGTVRSLSAAYTANGKTVSSSVTLTISNAYDIKALEIIGESSLEDKTSSTYSLRVTFTDNTTYSVPSDQVTWSLTGNSIGATISPVGLLSVPDVTSDSTVVLQAGFTYLNEVRTATWTVNVVNSYKVKSLTIIGNVSVNDKSTATFTSSVEYTDGTLQTVSPKWTLTQNEVGATISQSGTVTIPTVEYSGSFAINASYTTSDGTVSSSKLISVTKQKTVNRIEVVGWDGNSFTTFDGKTYAYSATEGTNILPGNSIDSVGYVSVWVDFSFGGFHTYVGGGTNGKYLSITHSGTQLSIKLGLWQQDTAYRVYSIQATKPLGVAHVAINTGDKNVWINGSNVGTMSLDSALMADAASLDTGLWINASPAPTSVSQPIKFIVSRITNLVFGNDDINDSQATSLYNTGVSGDYFASPYITAWYKLRTDSKDYYSNKHLFCNAEFETPNLVFDNKATALSCMVVYDDETAESTTASFSLDTNSYGITLSGNTLTVPDLPGDGDAIVGNCVIHVTANGFTKDLEINVQNNSWVRTLKIVGSASVNEDSTTTYTCTAYFENDYQSAVSPDWSITGNSIGATFVAGVLTVPVVGADSTVTLHASYTSGGITTTTSKMVIVSNVYKLDNLAINGSDSLDELTQTAYTCTAMYNDLTFKVVDVQWSLAQNNGHTVSTSGIVSTIDMSGSTSDTITLQASYTENGITKQANKVITVQNSVYLSSLTILGPAVNYGTSEKYSCIASLSNNSVVQVTPVWSLNFDNAKANISIDSDGTLHVDNISTFQTLVLGVSATYNGVNVTNTKSIKIGDQKVLTDLDLGNSLEVDEYTISTFSAEAIYSDNTKGSVNATWELIGAVPASATLSGNKLTVYNVDADTPITIQATYSENGVTVSKQATVLINNSFYPKSLAVSGNTDISDKTSVQYVATATYPDDSGANVSAACTWSVSTNNIGAVISNTGLLTVPNIVIENQLLTISASYTESGITVTDSLGISVSNLVAIDHLTVIGSDTVNDFTGTTFVCKAVYPDSSEEVVSPSWSLFNNYVNASIDTNGILTVPDIDADTELTVVATYMDGSNLVSGTKDITVLDTYFEITNMSILVADEGSLRELDFAGDRNVTILEDNKKYNLSCSITTPKGGTRVVPAQWSLSIVHPAISIDQDGVLTIDDISGSLGSMPVSFNITTTVILKSTPHSTTESYTVKNLYYLKSISIDCDTTMYDNTTQQLECIAIRDRYQKNEVSQSNVNPVWEITGTTLVANQNSFTATISSSGLLSIGDIGQVYGYVYVRATLTEGGITQIGTTTIKVNNTIYPTSLVINGPDTVDDNAQSTFSFTVTYSDESSVVLDPTLVKVSITNARVSTTYLGAGIVKVIDSPYYFADGFKIQASFKESYITVSANKVVAVNNSFYPDHFNIVGPDSVNDMTRTTYRTNLVYSNGYEKAYYVSNMTWSVENTSSTKSVSANGLLTLGNIVGNDQAILHVQYLINGVTLYGSKTVAINDFYKPTSLLITGPNKLYDKRSYTYQAYVVFTNGAKVLVSSKTSWGLSDSLEDVSISNGNVGTLVIGDTSDAINTKITASVNHEGVDLYMEYAIQITNLWGLSSLSVLADYPATGLTLNNYGYMFSEQRTFSFYARVIYTDASKVVIEPTWEVYSIGVDNTANYTWWVDGNRLYISIGDLVRTSNAYSAIGIRATYTEKGKTVKNTFQLNSANTYYIQNLVITSPTDYTDMSRNQITCAVGHTMGGPTVDVIPSYIRVGTNRCAAYADNGGILVIPDMRPNTKDLFYVYAYYEERERTLGVAKRISVVESYGIGSLAIDGLDIVADNSVQQYLATANYSNGSSKPVTPKWSLSNNNIGATIDVYGKVSIPDNGAGHFTINASYIEDSRSAIASKTVTVVNDYYATALVINGVDSVSDRSNSTYSCAVSYSNSTTASINPTWSVGGMAGITITSAGVLLVSDTADGTITINASYTESGITVTKTKAVTVINNYKVESIEISGNFDVFDNSTTQYLCTATYTDATTKPVVVTWSVPTNSLGITVNSYGQVRVPNILSDSAITLNASYTEAGITVTTSHLINISDRFKPAYLTITGVSTVTDKTTTKFGCTTIWTDNSITTDEVVVWSLINNEIGATIDESGNLTVPNLAMASGVTLVATLTTGGSTITTSKDIAISDTFIASSLVITGSASFDASNALTQTYTATVTYSDTTTAIVNASWSIIGNAYGCGISSVGVLTVPSQNIAASLTIQASYVEAGVTVIQQKTITWTVVLPTSLAISGSNSIDASLATTKNYTATVTYSDTTTAVVNVAWNIVGNAYGCSIDSSGLLTVPAQSSSNSLVIQASYTEKSATVTNTYNIAMTAAIPTSLAISGSASFDASSTTTKTYTATVTYSDTSSHSVTATWSISGLSYGCTIDSNGVLTVPVQSTAVTLTVEASYVENSITVSSQFNIDLTVIAVNVDITPTTVLYISGDTPTNYVDTVLISGSSSINATNATTSSYSATAQYIDGTSQSVVPTWSVVETNYGCTIDSNGVLTVPAQQQASALQTIRASYTEYGVVSTATHEITLVCVAPNSISISGSVELDTTNLVHSQYAATVTYSDASTSTVSPTWSLASNNCNATIDSDGVLTIPAQSSGSLVIVVSYIEKGITVTAQLGVSFTFTVNVDAVTMDAILWITGDDLPN